MSAVSTSELAFLQNRVPSMEQVRRRINALLSVLGGHPSIKDTINYREIITPLSMRTNSELPYLKLVLNVIAEYFKEVFVELFGQGSVGTAVNNEF